MLTLQDNTMRTWIALFPASESHLLSICRSKHHLAGVTAAISIPPGSMLIIAGVRLSFGTDHMQRHLGSHAVSFCLLRSLLTPSTDAKTLLL